MIATSRVSVDGARSLPLETLAESDAQSLAFRYSDTRQVEINKEGVDRIVKSSQRNPLALRLSIDLIAEGSSIDVATKKAANDVVGFSFRNLVSALSDEGLNILECLFVKSPMGRGEIVSLLGLSSEKVVENARRLARTSLVRREIKGEDEEFDLNPSVRDLLRDCPAKLDTRRNIQRALQDQRKNLNRHRAILRGRGINEYSDEFLPDTIPTALGNTLARCIRYYKGSNYSYKQTNKLAKELAEFSYTFGSEWRIWLWLGRLHTLLQDDKTAEDYFKNAVDRSGESPVPLLALCEMLMRFHRFDEACECADGLVNQGFELNNEADEIFVPRIWFNKFRCLIELSKFDEIIEINESEIKSERLQVCVALFKCDALIRKVSHLHSDPHSNAAEIISKAIGKLEKCLNSGHYQKSLAKLIPFAVREVKHLIEALNIEDHTANVSSLLKKISNFIYNALESGAVEEEVREDLIRFVSWARDHKSPEVNARFSDPRWNGHLGIDSTSIQLINELRSSGFEVAKIVQIPNKGLKDGLAAFCFARLESGEQIFIHRDNVYKMEFIKWVRLREGTPVGVADLYQPRSQNLRVAGKVVLV